MLQYLVILWAIANIWWTAWYIKDTLKGKTKPNRITRLIRAVAPLIATFSALHEGITRSILPVFIAGFCPLLVFLSSFYNKQAYRKIEKLDYICLGLSIIALILWFTTHNAILVIIFAILSDLFAAIPTIIKARKYPETETMICYIWGLFSASTSFFAIQSRQFIEIWFPIYLILMCGTVIIWILRGKYYNKILDT